MELHALTYDLVARTWSGPLPDVDSDRTLVLATGAPAALAMADLRRAFPRSVVVGCGAASSVSTDLAVTLARFDATRIRPVVVPRQHVRAAAEAVVAEIASPELRAVLLLGPDTAALRHELAPRLPGVTIAAEQPEGASAWVASGTADTSRAFVAIGLYGAALVIPEEADEQPDLLLVTLGEDDDLPPVEDAPRFTSRTTTFDPRTRAWSSRLPVDLDSSRTLVLAFGGAELADQRGPLFELAVAFPRSTVVGCSGAGQVVGGEVRDGVLSVAVLRFGHAELRLAAEDLHAKRTPLGSVQEVAIDGRQAGVRLAASLARADLRAVLLFGEGALADVGALAEGLAASLPPHVAITGGFAGGSGTGRWLLFDGELRGDRVVAVGLCGERLVVGQSARAGWQAAGPERQVTRASGNVLHELDGGLALEVYRDDLALEEHALAEVALGQPLAFRIGDEVLFRTVVAFDEREGSLVLSSEVPSGSTAILVRASPSELLRGAEQAASEALAERRAALSSSGPDPAGDALALVVGGAGRRMVLGPRIHEETEAARRALGGMPMAGFYGAAEISSTGPGRAALQTQTFTLTTIGEAPVAAPPRRPPVVRQQIGASPPPVERRSPPPVSRGEPPRRPPSPPPAPAPSRGGSTLVARSLAGDDTARLLGALSDLDSERTLLLLVGSASAGPEGVRAFAQKLPSAHVVGISGRGRGISGVVGRFGGAAVLAGVVPVPDVARSYDVGRRLAIAVAHPQLRAVLVFGRAEQVRGTELVRGLADAVGADVVIAGALVARNGWVSHRGVDPNGILAIGLAGDGLEVGCSARGGVDPYPPERLVGRATGPAIYEIDGRPAGALVRLPQGRAQAATTGLGYALQQADDPSRVHRVVAIDERTRSILVDPPVASGTLVHVVRDDEIWLPVEAREAASAALAATSPGHPPAMALVIGAPPAGAMLSERDFSLARDALGADLPAAYATANEVLGRGVGPDAPSLVLTISERAGRAAPREVVDEPTVTMPAPIAPARTPPAPAPPRASSVTSRDEAPTTEFPRVRSPPPPPAAPEPPRPAGVQPGGSRSPSPIAASARGDALGVTRKTVGNVEIVAIGGRITESFQGERVGRELAGTVVIDLGRVERITSFGVREWLAMLRACKSRADRLYLSRCTEPFVNQLTMIRGFAGHGQIVSFYAPYVCTTCGTSYSALLDAERDRGALLAGTAPPTQCPRCGGAGGFDDEETSYFALASQLAGSVPSEIRAAIASLDPVVHAEPIEKVVDETVTRISVAAAVDGSTRWAQALDGVEGPLVLDFSRSPASNAEGAENLERALRSVAGDVTTVNVVAAPRWVVERLIRGAHLPRIDVWSMVAEAHCASCAANRSAVLVVADHAARIGRGEDPDVPCPRCGAPLSFTASRALLAAVIDRTVPEPASASGALPLDLRTMPTDPKELLQWTRANSRSLAPMLAVSLTSALVAITLFSVFLGVAFLVWRQWGG